MNNDSSTEKIMFNYFYRIDNLVNGKFYYGVHRTSNLQDGYMGSGVLIKKAINKYGKDNFKKEIIEFFDTYNDVLKLETEVVTEQLVLDNNCYNIRRGGRGGFEREISIKGASNRAKKLWQNPDYANMKKQKASETMKQLHIDGKIKRCDWTGRKHSDESKEKISQNHLANKYQQKEKNSQYGTCWITNGIENKKIHKTDLIPDGWKLGRKINNKTASIV